MRNLEDYPLDELKLIYRLLHARLPEVPDLMDSELLHELQGHLQRKATEDGVDVSLHAQWATWLNGGTVLKGV